MRIYPVSTALCLLAGIASADAPQPAIPQPVIDECTVVQANAQNAMSDCLKDGAVAYGMLALTQRKDFYGADAQRVIDGCRAANDTYSGTWTCFKVAAEEAAETRGLIGLEAMTDACYAAISEPATLERLKEAHQVSLRAVLGETYFSGGNLYHPFNGCPSPQAGIESRTEDGIPGRMDPEACAAYEEMDGFLASRTADEVEAAFAAIAALPENRKTEGLALLGVSEDVVAYVQGADSQENNSFGFIAMALIHRRHPDLLEKFAARDSSLDELDGLTDSVVDVLLGMALDGYAERCLDGTGK